LSQAHFARSSDSKGMSSRTGNTAAARSLGTGIPSVIGVSEPLCSARSPEKVSRNGPDESPFTKAFQMQAGPNSSGQTLSTTLCDRPSRRRRPAPCNRGESWGGDDLQPRQIDDQSRQNAWSAHERGNQGEPSAAHAGGSAGHYISQRQGKFTSRASVNLCNQKLHRNSAIAAIAVNGRTL
jgi:hypothetical protein